MGNGRVVRLREIIATVQTTLHSDLLHVFYSILFIHHISRTISGTSIVITFMNLLSLQSLGRKKSPLLNLLLQKTSLPLIGIERGNERTLIHIALMMRISGSGTRRGRSKANFDQMHC